MRSLKLGLLAATALTFGLIMIAPPAGAAQLDTQLAQAAAKPAAPKKMTRAEMDAREREITKQLNEAQLKK